MKKKKLKNLSLRKKVVSSLTHDAVKGGGSDHPMCVSENCPTNTLVKACSNHMCDSRLGGCPTYYCIAGEE
ncbi:hypothetical protein KORDIASMS9_04456 [Kordia sp. SMS9]|uniref:hypothetical protein n=1 Tax=Kordia sp. SMS9 TaxID=2282170 RepID=UPI000E107888|nr:hypothetical protein [Kordia sp. SMS9]AXG72188.1 hypothetical protein KORDIASMS9_04456 [Kordia sp. SMS9]